MAFRNPRIEFLLEKYLERKVFVPKGESLTLTQRVGKGSQVLLRDPIFWMMSIIVFVLLMVALILGVMYMYPKVSSNVMSGPNDLSFMIEYSPWLSVGDKETFTLTLVNDGFMDLTEVEACLVFLNAVPVNTPEDESTAVTFGDLGKGERQTRKLSFLLLRKPLDEVRTQLRVTSKEFGAVLLTEQVFRVARIPHVKSYPQKVGGMGLGLLGVIGGLFAEILKGVFTE